MKRSDVFSSSGGNFRAEPHLKLSCIENILSSSGPIDFNFKLTGFKFFTGCLKFGSERLRLFDWNGGFYSANIGPFKFFNTKHPNNFIGPIFTRCRIFSASGESF